MIKLFSSILLGFLRNPKLGSAISNDYVISRMATCDADNLCDYQSVLTSTHTNCLIRFVKERLVKSFSSQPRRAFYAFLICCQAFILKFFARNSFSFKHLARFDLSSREVNNTASKNAVNHLFAAAERSFNLVSKKLELLLKDKTPTCSRR